MMVMESNKLEKKPNHRPTGENTFNKQVPANSQTTSLSSSSSYCLVFPLKCNLEIGLSKVYDS